MGSYMIIKVECENKKYNDVIKLFEKEGYTFVESHYEDCNECKYKDKNNYKGCKTCTSDIFYTAWRGYAELPELIENNMDLVIDVWWIDLCCSKTLKYHNSKEKWYSIKKELKSSDDL